MNRTIDYRSNLYSLGVVLYQLLTGRLPCHGTDAMEWVHCHIAMQPPPPTDLERGVPPILSRLVMKLLAKSPDDRYQTATGLRADLEKCLAAWEAGGRIEDFPLAADDQSDRLQIPQRLYGREAELAILQQVSVGCWVPRSIATERPIASERSRTTSSSSMASWPSRRA